MSVLDTPVRPDGTTGGLSPVDRRRLRRRRQVLAALFLAPLVGLIVVASLGGVLERLSSPGDRRFEGVVAQNMGFERAYEPGAVFHVPLSYGSLPDVVLHRAEPQFVEGSAWVSVQMSMCRPRPLHGVAGDGQLTDECRDVVGIGGVAGDAGVDLGELRSSNEGNGSGEPGYLRDHYVLLLSLVPLAPGPIEVTAVELEYSDGDGRRTESYEVEFRIDPDRRPGGSN